MALIICSECGKKISDKADKCPNCGCPVSKKKSDIVTIKMSGVAIPKMYIFDPSTGKVFWEGYNGTVAKFKINKKTEVAIGTAAALKNPYSKSFSSVFTIECGKKYEFTCIRHFITVDNVLNEIDFVDSGL